jgi:hypothetical protein
MGMILVIVGTVIYLIGGIWLIVKAFQESILWGLGSLFIPLVGLVFAIMHWAECKKPFLYALAGFVLIILGTVMMPHPDMAMPVPAQ